MLFLNILLFLIQPYILYPLYNTLPLFCKSRSDTFSVTVYCTHFLQSDGFQVFCRILSMAVV